jgi:hypothetical protein
LVGINSFMMSKMFCLMCSHKWSLFGFWSVMRLFKSIVFRFSLIFFRVCFIIKKNFSWWFDYFSGFYVGFNVHYFVIRNTRYNFYFIY